MNLHQVFTFVAKQSFAVNWVPKQELGNQINHVPVPLSVRELLHLLRCAG